MKRLSAALAVALSWSLLTAQTAPTPTPSPAPSPTPTPTPGAIWSTAKPYTDDEFPEWSLKLRRFEIIAVGAFPIAYLFSGLGYDYVYYFSNGLPQENAPWPAGPGTSQWTTADEPDALQRKNYTLIATAAGISLLIATVDWLLGLDARP